MLDNYQDLIEDLVGTPTRLRELLNGTEAPPEATAVLAALRDREQAVHERVQRTLRERDPVLKPLPPGPDSQSTESSSEALSGFESARGELVSLLMNLTLRDWERAAIDENGKQATIAEQVEAHIEFEEEHLAGLERSLNA